MSLKKKLALTLIASGMSTLAIAQSGIPMRISAAGAMVLPEMVSSMNLLSLYQDQKIDFVNQGYADFAAGDFLGAIKQAIQFCGLNAESTTYCKDAATAGREIKGKKAGEINAKIGAIVSPEQEENASRGDVKGGETPVEGRIKPMPHRDDNSTEPSQRGR